MRPPRARLPPAPPPLAVSFGFSFRFCSAFFHPHLPSLRLFCLPIVFPSFHPSRDRPAPLGSLRLILSVCSLASLYHFSYCSASSGALHSVRPQLKRLALSARLLTLRHKEGPVCIANTTLAPCPLGADNSGKSEEKASPACLSSIDSSLRASFPFPPPPHPTSCQIPQSWSRSASLSCCCRARSMVPLIGPVVPAAFAISCSSRMNGEGKVLLWF